MQITTIACPAGITDANVCSEAPIWVDANGVEYAVTSGLLDGYTTSDPITAAPGRKTVVVDMTGRDALAAMGLTVKEVPA